MGNRCCSYGEVSTDNKKRVGYIVLPNGNKLEGNLTLKKLDNQFAQLIIKTDSNK